MSQMKHIAQLIKEMEDKAKESIELGHQQLTFLSELKSLFSEGETVEEKPKPKVTKEDVRQVLADKAGKGFKAEVKALLEAYGASSLSTLAEEHYLAVLEEAGGIGND